jgi:uncharacterized protein (DUF58 family)
MPAKPQVRTRLKSPLLPILVGILFGMQVIDPFQGWAILGTGLGLVWLASYLWTRSLAGGLSLTREMRFGWSQVGDHLEERFTLRNTSIFPAPWVKVWDHSDMPGYRASRVTGINPSSSSSWRTQGVCSSRGLFKLGPTSLHSSDPFGIYSITIENPATATLAVMPPVIPLPTIQISPGRRIGEASPRSGAPDQTVAAASVRPYSPGDSLRSIHWRTTARRDSPFIRIFDGTPAGDWWIILDLEQRIQTGQGFNSTIEQGVILAASLADRGLRNRRAVGLAVNAQDLVWLPPQEGSNRRWEVLRSLALVRPGNRSLDELLSRTRPTLGKRSSLVLITPNLDGDWIEALLPLVWLGAAPTVLLLDRVEPDDDIQTREARPLLQRLDQLGVRSYLITPDLLDRPEARPGQSGQWEWRVSPSGRAVAVRKPLDVQWKAVG